MPCLLIALALLIPRAVMLFIWMLTPWFGQAYTTAVFPILGFFFMPYTTLAYMAAMLNNRYQLSGAWIGVLIVAVVVDISHWGSSRYWRR